MFSHAGITALQMRFTRRISFYDYGSDIRFVLSSISSTLSYFFSSSFSLSKAANGTSFQTRKMKVQAKRKYPLIYSEKYIKRIGQTLFLTI